MAEKVKGIDELFQTAALTRDRGEEVEIAPHHQRLLQNILARADTLERIFGSDRGLAEHLARRRDAEAVQARMAAEVSRRADLIARLAAEDPELKDLPRQPPETQYRVLVTRGLTDPSAAFGDLPEPPPLCGFKKVSDALKSGSLDVAVPQQQQFNRQWANAYRLFATRWEILTERPFDGNVPWVEELMRRKAPVPLEPTWLASLASREARALHAEPPAPAAAPAARARARAAADADDEAPAGNGEEDAGEGGAAVCGECRAEALLARAGVPPLAPPTGDQPRYTFPGQLLQREDIFYDYGLVVPVEECGPLAPKITGTQTRALTAVRAVAGEVLTILGYLEAMGLAPAFGQIPAGAGNPPDLVTARLRASIEDLLQNVDEATPLHEIEGWKRTIAEWATAVRNAARRRLFLSRIGGQDPRDFLNALDGAIVNLPPLRLYREERINYGQSAERTDYLELNGLQIGNVRYIHGNMSLDENDQVRNLRSYLEYLAGDFYTGLQHLVTAASSMRDAVLSFQGNAQQVQDDFEKLATGAVNEAALVLARLLDDIASQLPLWSEEWSEGSMRLGLLVIFRQYWSPEGYVKGKLVGYKNLIPDQKEKIRRRTFIKTVSEQLTTQEFARTRQQDYSRTQKETSEVVKENASKFNMAVSASGGFDIGIGSLNVTTNTGFELSSMSRSTRSSLAEASMKSSMSCNEKREVKLREETETQDELESITELHNPNQEITANYFYYQLLRQYLVTVELHDVRPVLLRTRHVPSEPAIDDKFLADYAHVLINVLPPQLAADLQETVDEVDARGRNIILAQARFFDDQRAYEDVLRSTRPADADQARERDERLAALQETARDSYAAFTSQQEAYSKARVRLDRVLEHVRSNRCHYMQFIWQASPTTDYDRILRTETFGGVPLPELTRGLQRQGYFGNEEIFDFVGPSWALADALLKLLTPGSDLAALPEDELRQTALFQQLSRYYSDAELDDLLEQIRSQSFVTDPASRTAVLSSRRVQIAQDALVVETLPGQIPLLEGFKAAHRMLDLERACLENTHLAARIADKPWQQHGEDTYRVYRREGEPLPVREEEP
jgi:hypothetical protein